MRGAQPIKDERGALAALANVWGECKDAREALHNAHAAIGRRTKYGGRLARMFESIAKLMEDAEIIADELRGT